MTAAAPYVLMAKNNAWANATLFAAVTGQAFHAPGPGFFGTLARTLNHIYEVDRYYIDALESGGQGRAVFDREDVDDPGTLAALQAQSDARLILFCEALDADRLTQTRETEREDGLVRERVDALLLHLFQHQVHHRGQAHVQLQAAGVAPPQLDDFHLDFGRVPTAAAYFGE